MKSVIIATLLYLLLVPTAFGMVVRGQMFDNDTKEPIPFVSVTLPAEGQSILGNEEGYFKLKLSDGPHELKFSHVAYYSKMESIAAASDEVVLEIYLDRAMIELPDISVYEKNYDAAQRIIIEAIRRKDEILSALNSYNCEAYTKLIIKDTSKDELTDFLLITETQLKAYWRYPDEYKEVITARKQSANIDPTNNLVTVGEILNFNSNRIDIGKKSLVSPTAKDALDYYNYYLLDTLLIDSSVVFLFELEPKSESTPLLAGTIMIADSSFAVVGVKLGVNDAFDNPLIKELKLEYAYQEFESKYWMPTVIKYDAIVDIPFPTIPVVSIAYTAALHKYQFEPEDQDTVFDEYVLEVDESADEIDSAAWYANQMIPLTALEEIGYDYIDSVENNKPLYKKVLPLIPASIYLVGYAQDFFHFNPVEGAYLGAKVGVDLFDERLKLLLKSGYAFDADLVQHRYGFDYTLDKKSRLAFGAEYSDMAKTQHSVISNPNGNSSLKALFYKADPYDYHREKGFTVKTSVNPLSKLKLGLSYNDYEHFSLSNNSDFSLFNRDADYRINAQVAEGRMRSIMGSIGYDSRNLMRLKGKERKLQSYPLSRIEVGYEKSDPSWFDSDFEFSRIYASLYTERGVLGAGTGRMRLSGGKTLSGDLPPQRYFAVDFASDVLMYDMTFKTIDIYNFTGNRVVSFYYDHDFGTLLFKKSGIPLIEDLPISLSLHGGFFWTDFHSHDNFDGDEFYWQTDRLYRELGFGIGRLGLFRTYFTWQLSDYDTDEFNWGLDIGF